MQEDAALVEKRTFLVMRQQRLRAALAKIDEFAPDVVAMSRLVACRDGGSGDGSIPTLEHARFGGGLTLFWKVVYQVKLL